MLRSRIEDRKFTEDEQQRILEEAQRLQERFNHRSIAEIQDAAAEVGIRPEFVRMAAHRLDPVTKPVEAAPRLRYILPPLAFLAFQVLVLQDIISREFSFSRVIGGHSFMPYAFFLALLLGFTLPVTRKTWVAGLAGIVGSAVLISCIAGAILHMSIGQTSSNWPPLLVKLLLVEAVGFTIAATLKAAGHIVLNWQRKTARL